jgi:hypothetical protein
MALRQPLPKARRNQQHLVPITPNEVLTHTPNRPRRPGRTQGIYATATAGSDRPRRRCRRFCSSS